MRFTRIAALFLTLAVPYTAYAQQPRKPGSPSRTTTAPQPPPQRPASVQASRPQMSPEKAFYYSMAIHGHTDGDVVEVYGKNFDALNYKRAMADEFERSQYSERVRAWRRHGSPFGNSNLVSTGAR